MECRWCSNDHAPADLCRARRVNRRSFFGVFAAVGVAALAPRRNLTEWAATWSDDPPVLGALGHQPRDTFEAWYVMRRGLPDGTAYFDWIEVNKDGHMLIPARDLGISARSPLGRLTSIPTRD